VFILEYYFASKSFVAVLEAFSGEYLDREVPNKTVYHETHQKGGYLSS
jgi:hypothetical protein